MRECIKGLAPRKGCNRDNEGPPGDVGFVGDEEKVGRPYKGALMANGDVTVVAIEIHEADVRRGRVKLISREGIKR